MRQDIIDSISRMDDSAFLDTAYTFNMVSNEILTDYLDGLLKPGYLTHLKREIKRRALADENIAEYVLQY
jgi:hypothetical protein